MVKAEEVIREVARLCRSFQAKEVILYGSRAKETARERSDIDMYLVAGSLREVLRESYKANLIDATGYPG